MRIMGPSAASPHEQQWRRAVCVCVCVCMGGGG